MKSHLHVVQLRAVSKRVHGETMRGLGLRGVHSEVWVKNTPSFRGAIKKVMHLITVEESDAPAPKPAKPAAKKK
ncbi:MAG TPA: 50S ribosomal protein L30 [Polyangiaceae bacterium]|jgi:large subunit ribosomal protein L30|nr:50S ribosomal protein L30 [Polyangiaceae bacterium]